ncbi:hypothetical protein NDU88_008270, partial [Pleurodeles waltl]
KGSTIVDIGKDLIGGCHVISAQKDKKGSTIVDIGKDLIGGCDVISAQKDKTDPKSMFTDVENLIGGAVGQSDWK